MPIVINKVPTFLGFTFWFHAVFSAYLSIAAGIVETVLSVKSGVQEDSMSLYGIALMAFVDITGSILVLSLWQFSSAVLGSDRPKAERIKEMNFSMVIGYLMIILGIFLSVDSAKTMADHHAPRHISPLGFVVAVFGTCCSMSLAAYKVIVGKLMESPVIVADAVSSFCSGLTSGAALVIVFIGRKVWWSDSVVGFITALYTLYSGITTVMASRAEKSRLQSTTRIDSISEKSRQSDENELEDLLNTRQMPGHYSGSTFRGRLPQRSVTDYLWEIATAGWFKPSSGYYRIPEIDSEIDDDVSFAA